METNRLFSGQGKLIFIFAVAFFLAVKIALVTVPTIAASMPRLGDDSLEYLWKAVLGGHGYSRELPAVADIAAQTGVVEKDSKDGLYWKARIRKRTFDTHSYFYDWLNRQILATGLSLKWAFAVSEVFMAILLAAGLALFLNTLFGARAAALALVFLSLAVFARPGLHFLTPSNGTLGLALILYHHLLMRGRSFSYAVILPLAVLLLGFHSIAKVYLVMAVAVHAISLPALKDVLNRRSIILASVLVGLPLCLAVLPSLVPGMARFLTVSSAGDMGHLANLAELEINLRRSWSFIADTPFHSQLLWAGGIAGAGVCLKLGRSRQALLLAGLGLALAVVSQFHFFPGYPAAVFNRLSLFLYVLLFGIAAWLFTLALSLRKPPVSLTLALVALLLIADGVRNTYGFAMHNLNFRRDVIRDAELSDQLRRLPDGAVAVYLDAEVALTSSLIAGGYRHGAISVQAYVDAPRRLVDTIRRRKPTVAVIPNFKNLNILSSINSSTLTPRRHGFPFVRIETLLVTVQRQLMGALHLYIRNPGAAFTLTAVPASEAGRKSGTRPTAEVPAEFTGWLQFKGDFSGLSGVTIALPAGPAWIEGVSLEPPRAHLFWPWRREGIVGFRLRGQKTDHYTSIIFTVERLLGRRLGFMRKLFRRRDPVLSDDSGLVFMKTVFHPD